ncbi:MAG: hypothetical protein NXH75_13525, partial [Halobacteriovoraceae bacterium]|nr:hypothetical protein [Halobacteriovoraceae bacterium]
MKAKSLVLISLFFLTYSSFGYDLWVQLDHLAPTQMNIGEIAMQYKVKKIQKKAKKGELLDYLKKKKAPAYLGPDGRYYIFDRHHTSRALYEANVSFTMFYIDVLKDCSHLTMNEFFTLLSQENKLYLYDNGVLKTPNELPLTIFDLSNDPYRSLSWMVREEGGFKKVDVPFLEFMWADFLRAKIKLT